jgi:hypothetical protein
VIDYNKWNGILCVSTPTNNGRFTRVFEIDTQEYFGHWGAHRIMPFDYNGDGLHDILAVNRSESFILRSNGDGNFDVVAESSEGLAGITDVDGSHLMALDYNGDGKSDLLVFQITNPYGTGGKVGYARSNGDGTFHTDVSYTHEYDNYLNEAPGFRFSYTLEGSGFWITAFDYNGDGTQEILHYGPRSAYEIVGFSEPYKKADLLSKMSKTYGTVEDEDTFHTKTQFIYKPSSNYKNSNLPIIAQTISKVTTDDGVGRVLTSEYDYEGGRYDFENRDFLGFNKVSAFNPDNTQTITFYHQDEFLKGKADKIEVFVTNTGEKLLENDLTWEAFGDSSFWKFVKLKNERTDYYENDAVAAFSNVEYGYNDDVGFVTYKKTSGTSTSPNYEEKIEEYEYWQDPSNEWLWRLGKEKISGSNAGFGRCQQRCRLF